MQFNEGKLKLPLTSNAIILITITHVIISDIMKFKYSSPLLGGLYIKPNKKQFIPILNLHHMDSTLLYCSIF